MSVDDLHALTDHALVSALARGSSAALGVLFDRYSGRVYTFCFRRVGSWDRAEDLTSAVFLQAWRSRAKAASYDGSALPWLLTVALNITRNAQRTQRRREAALDRAGRLTGGDTAEDHADRVAQRVDDERRMAHLLSQLSDLPSGERDVLALVAWSGLTYEQAAAALGVPVGTVRSRLSRARKRLTDIEGSDHSRGRTP